MSVYAYQLDGGGLVTAVVVADVPAYGLLPGGDWVAAGGKGGIGWRHFSGRSYPEWFQIVGADGGPPGAEDGYRAGRGVWHAGVFWLSATDGNIWEPGVAGWHRADGAWTAPTAALDAYALGAEVTHAGQRWVSGYAANIWEPGVFGWEGVP